MVRQHQQRRRWQLTIASWYDEKKTRRNADSDLSGRRGFGTTVNRKALNHRAYGCLAVFFHPEAKRSAPVVYCTNAARLYATCYDRRLLMLVPELT